MGVVNDLRLEGRVIRLNPGFATVAVLTLALGVGSTAAIFAVVDAVVLRPFAVEDSDRLVQIVDHFKEGRWEGQLTFLSFLDYRRGHHGL